MFSTSNFNQVPFFQDARRLTGVVMLMLAVMMPMQSLAQVVSSSESVRLAPGDVIQISVPGRPDLSSTFALDASGKVQIPQVGDVALQGLTSSEAEFVLRQRLRLFDPSIDKIEINLQSTRDDGTTYFIIGAVVRPGEYTFAFVPTFWDLLRAAGGPSNNANLRQVRHIREEDGRTQVSQLDLSSLLEGGEVPDISLKPGDTLVLPALLEGISAVPSTRGVKVFGAVNVPTVVDISEPTPMLDVLMLAGAPSASSELEEIWWLHNVGDVPQTRIVDMHEYLRWGDPMGNPLVYPGDTVRVEYFQESWFRRTLPLILGTLVSAATLYLLWDRIENDGRVY